MVLRYLLAVVRQAALEFLVGTLSGKLPVFFEGGFIALHINGHAVFSCKVGGEFHREPVGVVQLECKSSRNGFPGFFRRLGSILPNCFIPARGLAERSISW